MREFHLHTISSAMPGRGAALLLLFLLLAFQDAWSDGLQTPRPSASDRRPLGSAVTDGGRIASTASGAFDARGWRLTTDPHGVPRFLKATPQADAEDAGWDDRFGPAGGTGGGIFAVAVDGKDIFIGGSFKWLDNRMFNGVARWDGSRWSSLGSGVDGMVLAMAIVGDRLYVGGQFVEAGGVISPNFAIWNRSASSWTAIRNGVTGDDDGFVSTILVKGSELYVSGKFNAAGNTIANNVARYDGSRFSRLGAGTLGPAFALALNGDYLYVGGFFTSAGNVPVKNLARISLSTRVWEAVGTGTDSAVFAIAGDGNDIYIGGRFDMAGDVRANNIVRWNEVSRVFSTVAGGITTPYPYPPPVVRAIAVDGDDVYLGGMFQIESESGAIRCFARYHKPSNTLNRVGGSMIAGDKGPVVAAILQSGRELYIVGDYPLANGMAANGFSIYDMDAKIWRLLGGSIPGLVRAGAYWKGDFIAGGSFKTAGGTSASNIARWRDGRWFPLSSGVYPSTIATDGVWALAAMGDRLIAGGSFTGAGGKPAGGIAAWDGSQWQPLGNGLTGSAGARISALATIGASVYAGGIFDSLDNRKIWGLARWDGTAWSPLGSGIEVVGSGGQHIPGRVEVLLADGDLLYVAGTFDLAGGLPARGLAIWNAAAGSWSVPDQTPDGAILAMTRYQGKVIVTGAFDSIGTMPASVAAYDPATGAWSSLVDRFETYKADGLALASDGRYLYLGGSFTALDTLGANFLAKWDASGWSTVGTGTDGRVEHLTADSAGVFLMGSFTQTGPVDAYRIGHWTPQQLAAAPIAREDAVTGGLFAAVSPNPMTEAATVTFSLPSAARVSIEIFSPAGAPVASLADDRFEAGTHSVVWRPDGLSAGLYLCRITADGRSRTRPVLLVH